MATEKDLLYHSLYQKQRKELLARIKGKYDLLYWTMSYHQNEKGKPIDFTRMYYLLDLYKIWDKRPLISGIKSVQVGGSELFIADSHMHAAKGRTVMYVLPKYKLRDRFVGHRVQRLHRRAAYYAQLIREAKNKGGADKVSLVHFGLGAIAYVGSNVEDEFAEMPVDISYIDEYDRCNQRNILLLPDRLTASDYKYQREIGNPTIEGFGIDERFMRGTRSEWFLTCDHCNHKFIPDFFTTVVREVGSDLYEPRDSNYIPDTTKETAAVICPKCNKRVDRLQKGEWVAEYPSKEWFTFRISGVMSRFVEFNKLIGEWLEVGANKTKQQIFYNSRLGKAYSAAGAKILDWMLERIKRPYRYPIDPNLPAVGVRMMGVDVGSALHYVVRERVRDNGVNVRRLVDCGEARNFQELRLIIKRWSPKITVIDANPELHEVASLKNDLKNIYSSTFQKDLLEIHINKEEQTVKMDRTAAMDGIKAQVDSELLIIPAMGRDIAGGQYYVHMMAPTRLLEEDDNNPDKARFVWREGSKPDHWFLAEVYCDQADSIIPETSVFEYFDTEAKRVDGMTPKGKDLGTMIANKDTKRLEQMTPEIFQTTIKKTVDPNWKTRQENDVADEIINVADSMLRSSKKIDLHQFSLAVGLHEPKAEQFLLQHGYIKRQGAFYKDE